MTQQPLMRTGYPPQPATRPRRKLLFALLASGAAALVLVLLISAVVVWVVWLRPPKTFAISGDMTISGSGLSWGTSASYCRGDGGYGDINEGTNIVVTDAEGTTIAVGHFDGEGTAAGPRTGVRPASCVWQFTIKGVPEGSDFYGVTVGRRGAVTYPRAQLDQRIHLTLN